MGFARRTVDTISINAVLMEGTNMGRSRKQELADLSTPAVDWSAVKPGSPGFTSAGLVGRSPHLLVATINADVPPCAVVGAMWSTARSGSRRLRSRKDATLPATACTWLALLGSISSWRRRRSGHRSPFVTAIDDPWAAGVAVRVAESARL